MLALKDKVLNFKFLDCRGLRIVCASHLLYLSQACSQDCNFYFQTVLSDINEKRYSGYSRKPYNLEFMLPKFIMCNLLRWFCFPDSMLCSVILNNLVCTDKVDSERALENLAYDENYAISQIKSGYSQYRIVYCVAKGVYFGISLAPFSKRYLPFIKPTVK